MNKHFFAIFVRFLDYDPYRIHLFPPLMKCIILGRSTDVLAKPSAPNGMAFTSKGGVRPRYLLAPPELNHPKPIILYNFISCSIIISHQQHKMPRWIKLSYIRQSGPRSQAPISATASWHASRRQRVTPRSQFLCPHPVRVRVYLQWSIIFRSSISVPSKHFLGACLSAPTLTTSHYTFMPLQELTSPPQSAAGPPSS